MRLKLNKTLRAALIAAITAVGTTLPQSFATTTEATILTLPASVAQIQPTPTGWNQSIGAQLSITGAVVANDLKVCPALATDGWHWALANAQNQCNTDFSVTPDTQSFQFKGRQGYGGEFVAGTVDVETLLSDASAVEVTQLTFNFAKGSSSQGDVTFSAWHWDGESATATALVSASTSLPTSATDYTWTAEDSGLTTGKILIVFSESSAAQTNTINNFSATATLSTSVEPVVSLTWAGTEQDHELTSSVWDDGQSKTAEYSSTAPLIFNADGYKTVAISSDATAKSIEVEAGDYTIDAVAGVLSMQKLMVDEGATLTLKGTVEVAGSVTVAEEHSLAVYEGAVLKVAGESAAKTLLSGSGVNNSGTVEIGSNVTIDDSLTSKMGGTVTVADGKKLTLGTTKDSHSIDLTSLDALVLGQGANIDTKALKVDINNLTANGSTLNMLDTKAKDTDGVVLHGTTTLEGDLTITGDWKYKINIEKLAGTGSLELTGGNEEHRAVIGDVDIDSLTVTNKMNNVDLTGTVALSGVLGVNGTTNVTGQNTMTVGGLTGSAALNVANGITFDVAEGGDYSYTGTLTVGGQIVKLGTGTQTISGYAMHRTVTAREGELVLSGDFAIDAITDGDIDSGFVNASGAVADNGFAYKSGNMIVYVEDGGTVNTEGATFTLGGQEVTVAEDGKYALEYTVDKTTLWVNEGTESLAAYKEDAGDTLTTVGLAAGTTINMDSDGASIALAMQGSATVNATAAATISSISGWENHTLNIDGTSEVTLANLTTLTGSSALEVKGGTLNTKKFMLNSADASLKVNDGTTMNVTGDLTPTHGSVEVAGEVNISGSLDLSNGGQADVQLKIDSTGTVTAGSMWMAQAARVALEENGTFNIGNLQIVGKEGGSITTSTNNVLYGTTNTNFTINSATLSANGNVTIGNTLVDCDVLVDGGHTVTLNAAAGSVTVRDGGTINKGEGGSITNLMVEEGGIVGSGVETSQAKIADGATATYAEGLDDSNVYFYEDESGETKVQVTNNTGAAAAYDGIANTEMKVTAGEMIAFTGEDVEVLNSLVVNSVSNLSTGSLTINTIDTDALASIETYGGQVTLMNVASEPIVLNDLTITADSIVALYQGATVAPEQEASVTIAAEGVLTAGGGTLLANLTLMGESTLNVYGGDDNALTLGSTLTLDTTTGLINLDNDTLIALDALEVGESLTLVKALDQTSLAYDKDYNGEWFGALFNREGTQYSLVGDYQAFSSEDGFGLTKFSNVPEPTTGTLSLLALMALAARRRRK